MLDFFMICTRSAKQGVVEVYPKFIIKKSSDLMIRGGDFYAVWLEESKLWSTDEQDVIQIIDRELDNYANENREKIDGYLKVRHMWDCENGMIDNWHKYCQRQMRDSFHMLDEKIVFSNMSASKEDYVSRKLDYPLAKGDCTAYDKLMSTLYSEEERRKIEWAIGSIVTGDSKWRQKFMVLYGSMGSGKSTVINIFQKLFKGYYSAFDAKSLGSSNNAFALEPFVSNPLIAIQHDGDLSRIEDNSRLNSIVSHEMMTVNEKFKTAYSNRFKAFLLMGTNRPVKITDAKSGLLRRLIDVTPSGNKLPFDEYNSLYNQIDFELGAIAYRCKQVYENNKNYYDDYIPVSMLGASNDFYNFVEDSFYTFKEQNCVTLKSAWEMYKTYCDDANVAYPLSQRAFKEELKNYFREYKERTADEDGFRVRNYYCGFRTDKFEKSITADTVQKAKSWIELKEQESVFDDICGGCSAQYANEDEKPVSKWESVNTTLSQIDTAKTHYVKVPQNHIVIDFDIPDENGNKCLEKNIEAAEKFPPTYAELSKSEQGVHLHYIYGGDVSALSRVYDNNIEVKIFTGNSSLRRKLTKCNDLPISTINSGLPIKEVKKVINETTVKNEKNLRNLIVRNLRKEIHADTTSSINFIKKILDDAYNGGLVYDISDMKGDILTFAAKSTNQSDTCIKQVGKMHFKSDDITSNQETQPKSPLVFFDVEVFPNLFLVNYKIAGEGKSVVRMINPTPTQIEELMRFRLVGFNCRRYDNHILYARLMGYTNEQLYILSRKIISGDKSCLFKEAYNVSYTDVYDFSSKKQSLKKFEIELGIHHQELGLPWDKPVPEDMWQKVAEYCDNDVLATEAVFNARKADYTARLILSDVAGMTPNDTTNSLTTRIIFGKNRTPQNRFNYRNMGDAEHFYTGYDYDIYTAFDYDGKPIFNGYKYENGKSTYRGEEVGEGGYVYSEPGMYTDVALLDIASMHPSSIVAENLFGDEYTKRFKDILDARIAVKHKDFDKAKTMLNGKLAKYLSDESLAADLAQALKTAINSVYGLTSASFENPFRDIRNKDNIVAKRGALFMINLKHEVQKRGFTVAHIKTDSIKIPNATPEIISFVTEYGKLYGYNFEHEATYDRMCLVNDAVYIARYKDGKNAGKWTATGTQFQIPYVFKKLFGKEEITFKDMCETKSVSTSMYLDMNEKLSEGEHNYIFVGKVGSFCPIKKDCGGGVLYREKDGKYYAVTGSKGYRWLEAELVKTMNREGDIDEGYYISLVNTAVETISKYGDFEWFTS